MSLELAEEQRPMNTHAPPKKSAPTCKGAAHFKQSCISHNGQRRKQNCEPLNLSELLSLCELLSELQSPYEDIFWRILQRKAWSEDRLANEGQPIV